MFLDVQNNTEIILDSSNKLLIPLIMIIHKVNNDENTNINPSLSIMETLKPG